MREKAAFHIIQTLSQAGHIAYYAGGWVRDYLLGIASEDIDIASSASPELVQKLFPKTVPVGIAFGIVIVVVEGFAFEVASFRKDKEYIDGRRPSAIEGACAQEDAQRRDFTINGLFYDPLTETLWDFVEGKKDLEKGVIRAIGDARQRFAEDRLRMIRAVRYMTKFSFSLEKSTELAIIEQARHLFPSVAIERVTQELRKMAKKPTIFACALQKLEDLTLLRVMFPMLQELEASWLEELRRAPEDLPFFWQLLFLFPHSSYQEHAALAEYLKLSRIERQELMFYHEAKQLLQMPLSWQANLENWEWVQFFAHPLSDQALELFASTPFPVEKKELLLTQIIRKKEHRPLITAADLLAFDIAPSPLLGELLQQAERLAACHKTDNKPYILSLLQQSPLWPSSKEKG